MSIKIKGNRAMGKGIPAEGYWRRVPMYLVWVIIFLSQLNINDLTGILLINGYIALNLISPFELNIYPLIMSYAEVVLC